MKKLILGCCLLGWGTIIFAQQGTVAAGGDASGSGGSVSFSVGQVVYTATSTTNGSVNQGIQQPYELFVKVEESTMVDASVSLFPNPTKEFVVISVVNGNVDELSYQLLDIQGRVLATSKLENNETKVAMSNYANATYFVKVLNLNNNKETKTFKIIKTQ